MKEVHHLLPGVIYRIHWNGQNNDMIGTFLDHQPNGPRFTNVNYRNILFGAPGERPRKIDPHPMVFDPAHFTFYESGDTLQRKELLRRTLNGLVPGSSKYYTGRGTRNVIRKRVRSSRK